MASGTTSQQLSTDALIEKCRWLSAAESASLLSGYPVDVTGNVLGGLPNATAREVAAKLGLELVPAKRSKGAADIQNDQSGSQKPLPVESSTEKDSVVSDSVGSDEAELDQVDEQLIREGNPSSSDESPVEATAKEATEEVAEVTQSETALAHVTDDIHGTVSELMLDPIGVLTTTMTVAGSIDYLVHTLKTTGITYLYVTDDTQKMVGVVAMRDLLMARPGESLEDIMSPVPFSFSPDTPISEAVGAALHYRFRVYPVVDDTGRLQGLVHGWQLFERVATELGSQLGSMVGLDKNERVDTSIWRSFLMRHPWLQVNLLTAFAAAFVVGFFEDTIAQIVALAVFLPVLAGQSGNTGCQALAITLRGMTLGELEKFPVSRLLFKEATLGALNGFTVGLVAAAAMFFYASFTGAGQPFTLAIVVLIAMTGSCVGSGIFGVMVPITLRRFGADPAVASSIFLTTFTDILGMGLMLFLATSLVM